MTRGRPRGLRLGPDALTPREIDVVRGVARGLSNREIGREFWLEEQTIKFHLTNIFRKLGVRNRVELALAAIAHGLADIPVVDAIEINGVRYERVHGGPRA